MSELITIHSIDQLRAEAERFIREKPFLATPEGAYDQCGHSVLFSARYTNAVVFVGSATAIEFPRYYGIRYDRVEIRHLFCGIHIEKTCWTFDPSGLQMDPTVECPDISLLTERSAGWKTIHLANASPILLSRGPLTDNTTHL